MTSQLHFRKLWLTLGWLLIAIIIFLSLTPALPNYQKTLTFLPENIDKIGHFFSYFVLMGWFAQIYHVPKQRLWLASSFIILGILLEILQGLTGIRHPTWTDALANSLGILTAWIITKNRCQYLLITFEQKYLKP